MTTPRFLYAIAAIIVASVLFIALTIEREPEWVELDRATIGTVFIRPSAVSAILGPGEILLDDGAGTRHNAHTQVVVGAVLRINVRGTAAQVHNILRNGEN